MRALKIIWCIIAPLALVGGTCVIYYYCFKNGGPAWIAFAVWGTFVLLELPLVFVCFAEDDADVGAIMFIWVIVFAPVYLIVMWIKTVFNLIND